MGQMDLFKAANWYAYNLSRPMGDRRFGIAGKLGISYLGRIAMPDVGETVGRLVALINGTTISSQPTEVCLALTTPDDPDQPEVYLHKRVRSEYRDFTQTYIYGPSVYPTDRPQFSVRYTNRGASDAIPQHYWIDSSGQRPMLPLLMPEDWDIHSMPQDPPPNNIFRQFENARLLTKIAEVDGTNESKDKPIGNIGKSDVNGGEPYL